MYQVKVLIEGFEAGLMDMDYDFNPYFGRARLFWIEGWNAGRNLLVVEN